MWKVQGHNRLGYDGLLMSQHNSKMNNKQIGKGFFDNLTISLLPLLELDKFAVTPGSGEWAI